MNKFNCSICYKQHEFYSGLELLEPALLYEMTSEEREKRVYTTAHIHFIDSEFYLIESYLNIPIEKLEFDFSFKVWVKVN